VQSVLSGVGGASGVSGVRFRADAVLPQGANQTVEQTGYFRTSIHQSQDALFVEIA